MAEAPQKEDHVRLTPIPSASLTQLKNPPKKQTCPEWGSNPRPPEGQHNGERLPYGGCWMLETTQGNHKGSITCWGAEHHAQITVAVRFGGNLFLGGDFFLKFGHRLPMYYVSDALTTELSGLLLAI